MNKIHDGYFKLLMFQGGSKAAKANRYTKGMLIIKAKYGIEFG